MTNTTQKPSERIRELLGSDWALSSVAAIVQYLDEQAAAANPASLQVPLTAEDLTKRVWHQPEKAPQAEEAPRREPGGGNDWRFFKLEAQHVRDQLLIGSAAARCEKLTKERDELRSKVSELEEQRKREMHAWKLDCDRLTECRDQLTARDSEIARLREELESEQRACTQLHCDVSNALSRYEHEPSVRLQDFLDELRIIGQGNPHAKQADAATAVAQRAIVVGSTWARNTDQAHVRVENIGDGFVHIITVNNGFRGPRDETYFREFFTWVSDPPTVAPATGSEP